MKKLPAFMFYPGDWTKDPSVRCLTLEERGAWLELMCVMHECERRGFLTFNGKPMSNQQISCILGVHQTKAKTITDNLLAAHTISKDSTGILFSRRMVREEALRVTKSNAGLQGGRPKQDESKG